MARKVKSKKYKERYFMIDEFDGQYHCLLDSKSFYLIDVTEEVEKLKEKAWMYDELE